MGTSLAYYQSIVTVVFVADKVGLGFFDFVPTKVISQTLNIPQASMVKILGALTRVGIIETREGNKGGVRLALKPNAISLLAIYRALDSEKNWFRTDLKINAKGERPAKAQQAIKAMLDQTVDVMSNKLMKFTIADIIKTAQS